MIGCSASFAVDEGTHAAGTIVSMDVDGDALVFAIDGGPDTAASTIDAATRVHSCVDAPDFEVPADADGDTYRIGLDAVTVRLAPGAETVDNGGIDRVVFTDLAAATSR